MSLVEQLQQFPYLDSYSKSRSAEKKTQSSRAPLKPLEQGDTQISPQSKPKHGDLYEKKRVRSDTLICQVTKKKSNIIPRPVKNSLMLHYMTTPGDFMQPDWDLAERVSHLSSRSALLLQKTRNSGSSLLFSIWFVSQLASSTVLSY